MSDIETESLREELRHFQEEKEKVRAVVGEIGGCASAKRDKIINIMFIVAISALLLIDIVRHVFHVTVNVLPPLFSLELGLLLISIKIIWMIHKQARVEHFQFWILNSIEFRLTDLSKRMNELQFRLKEAEPSEDRAESVVKCPARPAGRTAGSAANGGAPAASR